MTAADLIGALSKTYGTAAKPAAAANAGDQEEVLAQWQDSQYSFDLIRSPYGPAYKLVGALKRLDAPVKAAIVEAARIDDKEAPQREAARIASEDETQRAKLAKARLTNKPRFRP